MRSVGLVIYGSLVLSVSSCGIGGGGVTPVHTAFNRGVYHYSTGDLDAAIAEFRSAVQEQPDDSRARFNLALALESRAREEKDGATSRRLREEAEVEYRRVVREDPSDVRAAVNLSAMEYENGDRGAAVARLRELIEREPHDSLAHVALAAHYLREARLEATAAGRERRLEVARLLLEETVTNDPSDVAANMLMGDILAALGQVSRARESYRRALERAPDDIATLMALARLDGQEGEYGGASMWAQRVLHIDPDHLGAHLVLVGALEAQGQLERATFHLWKARDLDRDSPPKVSREEYQRRLLRFYEELSERERSGGNY